RKPPALDGGQGLPNDIHFPERSTRLQAGAVQNLLVRKRHPRGRKREERGGSAGNETDDEIVRTRRPCGVQYPSCRPQSRLVRNGMRSLGNLDGAGRNGVTVTGDDKPLAGSTRP